MPDERERPKPVFRRTAMSAVAVDEALSTIPATPQHAIASLPADTPEWIFIAARQLVARHVKDTIVGAARIRYDEWARLLSSFRNGLLSAGLPDWMAQSLIMGVLDPDIGKAVDTLIRAVPHMAHAAVKGMEVKDASAWRDQLRARAIKAADKIAQGINAHTPGSVVLEQAEEILNPTKE